MAGCITPEADRSQIADEFRVMKRPIIKNAQGGSDTRVERGNCVMVTSALPSEGKTFVALNLAMSIASEVDSTVLLVDADVANPNLMKKMHLPPARGLLDLLTGDVQDLSDVLLKTNVEKLSLLPAGSKHRRATEMLASTAMAELVEQMSTRYPTVSSCSIRPRCSRRPKRASWLRTWVRSSWWSKPTSPLRQRS